MTAGLPARAAAAPGFMRRAAPVAAAGVLGLLALAAQPLPPALAQADPALAALPEPALRALLLLNPLLLLVAATLLGAALAHRAGLRSVLAGTADAAGLGGTLARAAAIGLGVGVAIAAADVALAPALDPAWQALLADTPVDARGVLIGVLYGGLAEEVMLRWGLMAGIAGALVAALGPARRGFAVALAIVAAALVFGLAHLPALALQIEPTPAIVARTVALNAAAGLVYGLLFARRHLEAAMAAHAASHLGLALVRPLAG